MQIIAGLRFSEMGSDQSENDRAEVQFFYDDDERVMHGSSDPKKPCRPASIKIYLPGKRKLADYSELESLAKSVFPKWEGILHLVGLPPSSRSNEFKDLQTVGRWVFEE
jgi:hypothetical protein